jgi:hypothetical protein
MSDIEEQSITNMIQEEIDTAIDDALLNSQICETELKS